MNNKKATKKKQKKNKQIPSKDDLCVIATQ